MGNWKKYSLLFSGIGVSNLGNWIYLIALNLLILDMTNSMTAIAGIYIVGPIARILTSLWAGSVIDRMNKRQLMIITDVLRGMVVLLVPFIHSIWGIYAIIFATNIAGAFFGPSSTFYISKSVDDADKKKFNSIMGVLNTGAFCTGPAIAGFLIGLSGITWCIIINAVSFFICAFCIYLLPDVQDENSKKRVSINLKVIKDDWRIVKNFMIGERYFTKIYLLFQATLMIAFALDSQEATFIKHDLEQSEKMYGLIVSLTGIGAVVGASASVALVKFLSLQAYLGIGMFLTSVGYLLFYCSTGFWSATSAFLFLGFFMSFSNAGFDTFYQKNVPSSIMGRFGGSVSILQNVLQITLTIILGSLADLFSLQIVAILFAATSVLVATILCFGVFDKEHNSYYVETENT
ncbi:MFS transporter [Rummeliibacillus sp. NPDC094406]|uniref:MFS transporter n=1 Tax=Rummeliibacillus sp. NPDC094406 TaxID=3364511 RepID=UPI00381C3CFE